MHLLVPTVGVWPSRWVEKVTDRATKRVDLSVNGMAPEYPALGGFLRFLG